MIKIIAKYISECKECETSINAGDYCYFEPECKGKKIICLDCGDSTFESLDSKEAAKRLNTKEKANQEQEYKTCFAKRQPKKPVTVEVSAVRIPVAKLVVKILHSFDVKETLKENGYSFDQYSKVWQKEILAGSSTQELLNNFAPEKAFLVAQGWELSKNGVTEKLFSA